MSPLASPRGLRLSKVGFLIASSLAASLSFAQSPRLSNLSTRGQVMTAADIMIAGLVVGPGTPDTVLIRAVGPTLSTMGVTGVLATPVLTLFNSAGTALQSNQGWGNGNATAAIMSGAGAFALTSGSADSAFVVTLPSGSYTAQVTGANGTTGVALLEVYEVSPTSTTARLANLSTRGMVGTGGNIMISGFSISAGIGSRTLLVRADGPSLSGMGLTGFLADPAISVTNTAGATVASNDNWGTPVGNAPTAATLSAVFTQFGAFPFASGSLDSALISAFPSGNYTAQVSGNSGTSGLALTEVYDITPSAPGAPDTVTITATNPNANTSGSDPGSMTVTRSGDASSALTV
jgi:hypothetical protein